jgi:hypothetical protein
MRNKKPQQLEAFKEWAKCLKYYLGFCKHNELA